MKISEVFVPSPRPRADQAHPSRGNFDVPQPDAAHDEAIIHLTLGSDGIWQIRSLADETPFNPTFHTQQHPPPSLFLHEVALEMYSSQGLHFRLEPTRGLLLDLYI